MKLPTAARRQVPQRWNKHTRAAAMALRDETAGRFPYMFPAERAVLHLADFIENNPITPERQILIGLIKAVDLDYDARLKLAMDVVGDPLTSAFSATEKALTRQPVECIGDLLLKIEILAMVAEDSEVDDEEWRALARDVQRLNGAGMSFSAEAWLRRWTNRGGGYIRTDSELSFVTSKPPTFQQRLLLNELQRAQGQQAVAAVIGGLSIANDAGFVHVLVREADIRSRNRFRIGSGFCVVGCLDFAAFLRRIIFVRQSALGEAFDFERISLSAIDSGNDLIMRLLGLRHAPGDFGGVIGDFGFVARIEDFDPEHRPLWQTRKGWAERARRRERMGLSPDSGRDLRWFNR